MKDKTKKWLVIAGLAMVCAGLIFGISRVLYREPVQETQLVEQEPEDTEITVETGQTGTTQAQEEETDTEEALVIEAEPQTAADSREQEIQKEPEKTENEKPKEAPTLAEDADIENPETQPAYEEPQAEENAGKTDDTTPSHGDTKDGMIYIDGFGWIPDEGGGGSGTTADDMYENGNKIGIMD